MRDVINKNHTEEELLNSVGTAAREGYTGAKLYFMCGLPTENDDDLRAILDLSVKAHGRRAREAGNRELPHHGERLAARAQAAHAVRVGRAGEHRRAQSPAGRAARRGKGKPVTLKYRDAETACSRACSRAATAAWARRSRTAYRRGCRFDAWSEHLRFDTWLDVFADHGIDRRALPDRALDRARAAVGRRAVPGHASKFLVRDKLRADQAGITDDCRLEDVCFSCGVVDCNAAAVGQAAARAARSGTGPRRRARRRRSAVARAARRRRGAPASRPAHVSASCSRRESRCASPRTWISCAPGSGRCAAPGCRSRFTQGHHPHLKMSFGPPLPLGYRSRAEVFDLEFSPPPAVDLAERLNAVLPGGSPGDRLPAHPLQDRLRS